MQKSQIIQPTALQAPFAAQGDKNIPNYEATGTETCSIKLGFLPITSEQLPPDGNGQAPERVDFNGMFYLTTDLRVYLQNGSLITFDSAVSTKIGGYPKDAILTYIDSNKNLALVRSCIENNNQNFITDPTLINGSVWEFVPFFNAGGAWQNATSSNINLTSVTAVGTYDIDLSGTLPSDGHDYECILRYNIVRRDNSDDDTGYKIMSSDGVKTWLWDHVEGDPSRSTNYMRKSGQFMAIVGSSRKLKLDINTKNLNSNSLDLVMYRRCAV